MPFLVDQVRLFFVALQRFTSLSAPRWVNAGAISPSRSTRYLPLIGVLIGASCGSVYLLAIRWFPPAVAVLFSMAASLVMSGALHEAESGKFWHAIAVRSREKTSASRIAAQRRAAAAGGLDATGCIAIAMGLLLKFALLSYLQDVWVVIALLCGHSLSRVAALILLAVLDDASAAGAGRAGSADSIGAGAGEISITVGELLYALLYGLLPLLALLATVSREPLMGSPALIGAGLAFAAMVAVGVSCRRRFGGINEAGFGAAQQLAELMFYVGLVASPR